VCYSLSSTVENIRLAKTCHVKRMFQTREAEQRGGCDYQHLLHPKNSYRISPACRLCPFLEANSTPTEVGSMCIRKLIHNLGCDARPLFTSTFEGKEAEFIVNPFGEPRSCDPGVCASDPQAPPLSIREECIYHVCCRVSFVDLRCSETCCPEQREKKGRLEDGISGLISGPSYRKRVNDCVHFVEFHLYVMSGARSVGPLAGWRNASYPYPELARNDAVDGLDESTLFCKGRSNLFRAGERLLIAKEAYIVARAELHLVSGRRDNPRGLTMAVEERFHLARCSGLAAQESFDDCREMVALLEHQHHGLLGGYPFRY